MKSLEEVLIKYNMSKKPISIIYKTHTGMTSDPRTNLIIEDFNKKTGYVQLAHYKDPESKTKDITIYTTIQEIARIIEI